VHVPLAVPVPDNCQTPHAHRLKAAPIHKVGQPPGLNRMGTGPEDFPAGPFPENFQPDFPKKILADFFQKSIRKNLK
jgi:hypothetical protein